MSKILAIDGNNVLSRAYYAIPFRAREGQTPKNGVLGFINIMLKAIDDYQPDYVFTCFDVHAPTFRHKRYAEYKAGRHPQPDELTAQFPILKEILKVMGVVCLEIAGYEADDLLGTISKKSDEDCGNNSNECFIMSGDRDCLQLISDKTSVILLTQKSGNTIDKFYNYARMLEEYSITPKEFIDVKALMGDNSDNIKGAFGIGEKSAISLISQFGSLENIYNNLEKLKLKQKVTLENFKNNWQENLILVTIDSNVPIEIPFIPFDKQNLAGDKVLSKLRQEGLIGLAARLETKSKQTEQISWF